METRKLGNTELEVSRLGIGLAEIGSLRLDQEATVDRLLNSALDRGINFFDTAACYGNSEELIGRTVAGRRDEYVLATKSGHASGETPNQPWTAETVQANIERSLRRLRTDHLDLVQLHSCDVEILKRGEVIQALQDARQAGKTRYIGYSGDNQAAMWAVDSGLFDTLQTSYNLVDQRARRQLLDQAQEKGMGVIAKRPIANTVWGSQVDPITYPSEYSHRAKVMAQNGSLPAEPDDSILTALGFTLAHAAVDTAIVGTSDPDHLQENIHMVEQDLPIPEETVRELQRRFDELDSKWLQES